MKKVTGGKYFDYPITLMDKENIREIFEIFQSNFDKVSLTIENYELENIDEIDNVPLKIAHSFMLQSGYSPYVYVEGKPYLLRLYLSNFSDTKQLGVKSKIDEVFSKTNIKKSSTKKFSDVIVAVIGLLCGIISALTISNLFLQVSMFIVVSILVAFLLSCLVSLTVVKNIHTTIILEKEPDKASFWVRNKDALIIGLLVTIVGGLIAGLTIIIIGKYFIK